MKVGCHNYCQLSEMDSDPSVSKAVLALTVIPLFCVTLMKISDEFVVLLQKKKQPKNPKQNILIHLSTFAELSSENLT